MSNVKMRSISRTVVGLSVSVIDNDFFYTSKKKRAIRYYLSTAQNKGIKLKTAKQRAKYKVVSGYYHKDFVALYVKEMTKEESK